MGTMLTLPIRQGKRRETARLYDMSGNVWEWWANTVIIGPAENPTDPASGSYRVIRGGGLNGGASDCAVASRSNDYPSVGYSYLGFRVICGN
jgi:formylglycine-generating enzyme required for sulfatase activity